MSVKYIFVTGGVLSGLGKGVSAASIGRLLKSRGYKVFVQKFDPYLNMDPGTMSPYEHGEVFVTADGSETDLDLGHYERFIDEKFTNDSNFTTAQIFKKVMKKEREGFYEGKTVQIVPHFTNEIEGLILEGGRNSNADFVIIEIGGTVGDIESIAYFKTISAMAQKYPKDTFFIHTVYIPYLKASSEWKTKPAQFSVAKMRELAINPNMILARSTDEISDEIKQKLAATSFIPKEKIISVPDANNIYKIPLYFENQNVANAIIEYFELPKSEPNLDKWEKFIDMVNQNKETSITIGMIGKYTKFPDAYMSIIEALNISSHYENTHIELKWINADLLTDESIENELSEIDGALILPGFGERGFAGKIVAAKYLREKDIPTFGICYGMQAMTIIQAKEKGIEDATSSEISKTGTFIFDFIRGKNSGDNIGGTLRLGESKTILKEGTNAAKIYSAKSVLERHRHRYEVNSRYIEHIEDENFTFSGYDEETNLAEICELKNKKFYLGVQYHPEFTARPLKPNPLFSAFLKSIVENKK